MTKNNKEIKMETLNKRFGRDWKKINNLHKWIKTYKYKNVLVYEIKGKNYIYKIVVNIFYKRLRYKAYKRIKKEMENFKK